MSVRRRSILLSNFLRERAVMQLYFIFIAFILQFHSAYATPMNDWQLIDVLNSASFPGQSNGIGYECGNDFFSDSEIRGALSKYHQYVNHNLPSLLVFNSQENQIIQQQITPQLYQGPLYSDSGSTNYILWPIQKEEISPSSSKDYSDSYFVVVKEINGEVVDVISKIITNDFTKCIRKNGSRTELSSSAPDTNDGYQCAHKFLSDKLIHESLRLAWDIVGKSNFVYPMRYIGRLYPANSNYLIWPIFSRDGLFDYRSVEAGPYFLVIDLLGNLIEIVVQGLSSNFLRCTRSRISSKRLTSNVPNHLSVPAPDMQYGRPTSDNSNHLSIPAPDVQSGYFCDLAFFSYKAVEIAARAARKPEWAKSNRLFPSQYKGLPFHDPVLLWPIMCKGSLFNSGSPGYHRVILTENFRVMGVGIEQGSTIRLCEEGIKTEIKNHEKSDFFCFDHYISNQDLRNAAKNGCKFRCPKKYKAFPARYMGHSFEKSGPYFIYPVLAGKDFSYNPGADRVVFNKNCEVVGAISKVSKTTVISRKETFEKCVKI